MNNERTMPMVFNFVFQMILTNREKSRILIFVAVIFLFYRGAMYVFTPAIPQRAKYIYDAPSHRSHPTVAIPARATPSARQLQLLHQILGQSTR